MPVLRRLRDTAHSTLRLGSTFAALAGGIANGSAHTPLLREKIDRMLRTE